MLHNADSLATIKIAADCLSEAIDECLMYVQSGDNRAVSSFELAATARSHASNISALSNDDRNIVRTTIDEIVFKALDKTNVI